ncbi:MAG: PAS domain S-box protein [Candidatus Rokubacteria bacterium]|nr:PAS domain S-box protein [Candidatus Rokubacteria bacterium]
MREDIEPAIRVEQSVHLVAQLPTLVIGNWTGALIGILLSVDHVAWPRLLGFVWIGVMTLPMAANWLKLRRKPRPAQVSARRIRLAAWHSLVMGLSWVVAVLLVLGAVPTINQASLLFGIIIMCTGAVASISALPYSALAYFVPMMTTVLVVSALHGALPYKPIALLTGLLFVALSGFLRQNWRTFQRNVAVAVERARLADEVRSAAEEVRVAQQRLQSIIDAIPMPLAIFRLRDARTVYANRWAADLVGLSLPDMLSRTSDEFFFDPRENRRILDGLRGGRTVVDHETRLRRGDGSAVPVRLASILMDYDGEKAILAAVEDITLRKEHEAQLDRARQAAEDASRAKSLFLANMSHELRTPLNAIIGYTELIQDATYGEVPPKIGEVLARVEASGRHLLGLINDVLDLSKIEAGQVTLSLGDYSMRQVVHTVAQSVESLAADKRLVLDVDVPADLPVARGDERRLTQVLLNLVGNALKFTDAGRVSVAVTTEDDDFLVSVSDTGPGIAAADQERIFEEFQQAEASATRAKGGTGLGLAIARRIVAMHGGRLWVESKPGEGSTFRFRVPVRAETRA